MDAFYAAVETLSDPSLKGKPMAVGGMSMISTANYEVQILYITIVINLGWNGIPYLKIVCPACICLMNVYGEFDPATL